ncbi:MAG: site-specific integrase [Candidatus Korobacteraceae bacterium]
MTRKTRGIFEKVPGSGVWWIRFADSTGRIRREKVGNKAAAIKLYAKRKTEVLQGVKLPENFRAKPVEMRVLIADALEHCRNNNRGFAQDRVRLLTILREFGSRTAASITPQDIERWVAGNGWSAGTINRFRATLSLIFRLGIANRKTESNPVKLVRRKKENNGRVRFLSAEEEMSLRAILASRHPEHLPELDIALNTGIRRGEQYSLMWKDVDFGTKLLAVSQTKNGETRYIPLNTTALAGLNELYRNSSGEGYVFTNRHGDRLLKGRHWFEPAVREANLKDFSWHCLRHTFASRLVMAGVDLRTVQQLMGHKAIQMTVRYAHLAPEHQMAAVERLCSVSSTLQHPTDTTTDTTHFQAPELNARAIN